MTAATTAADEVDPELERQWEERTRPSCDAPRVKSLYLRKNYAAACPQQHLTYLKCLKDAKSWVPFSGAQACADEYKAFAICKQRAKDANRIPLADDGQPKPSFATRLWRDLQREPLVIAAKMSVEDALQKWGFSSNSSSSSSTDESNSSAGGNSSGSNSGNSSSKS